MSIIRKLAGQTMVYGLGTIAPRLLNYLLLTPFYTNIFLQGEYGVVTELYAYSAFFLALLTFGMETTYFRYAEKEKDPDKVFSTSFISILIPSLLFILLFSFFYNEAGSLINYNSNGYFMLIMALIIGLEAISSIPFAKLRKQNKALKFALIKIINVLINIGLNLYFFVLCPKLQVSSPDSVLLLIYNAEVGVGYAFISNLVATVITLLILLPALLKVKFSFDVPLFKRMIAYALPILVISLAGMFNQVADKILLKYLINIPEFIVDTNAYVMAQLGVYGANYKLAVLMTIFTSMFRYAAEPFFFAHEKEKGSKQTYADVLKYFAIFGLIIFLVVVLYIDITKRFIGINFRDGLNIVPIVLLAQLFLGLFYNLSVWYKLTDNTRKGAYIALIGSGVTLLLNVLLVPTIGYIGAAWSAFSCYFAMLVISYFWGRKVYPINYDLKNVFIYFFLAIAIYLVDRFVKIESTLLSYTFKSLLFAAFLAYALLKEKAYQFLKKA